MLSFKQFLNAQEDDIEDMEAVKKYQEYKLEFRKTQLGDFFQQHKEEEWYVIFAHENLGRNTVSCCLLTVNNVINEQNLRFQIMAKKRTY